MYLLLKVHMFLQIKRSNDVLLVFLRKTTVSYIQGFIFFFPVIPAIDVNKNMPFDRDPSGPSETETETWPFDEKINFRINSTLKWKSWPFGVIRLQISYWPAKIGPILDKIFSRNYQQIRKVPWSQIRDCDGQKLNRLNSGWFGESCNWRLFLSFTTGAFYPSQIACENEDNPRSNHFGDQKQLNDNIITVYG